MLQLPNITLICVATRDHNDALWALINSQVTKDLQEIKYGAVKFLTNIYAECQVGEEMGLGIERFHIESFDAIDDWNKFIFYDLHKYIDTDYCLLIHPDGYIINPDSWDNRFLDYDYCGAPWPSGLHYDPYGNEVRVGNSVSIRSKRLLELPSKLNLPWTEWNGSFNEDTQITCHYRPYFIGAGMSFAPIEIAALFAHEIPIPEIQGITPFAFHEYEPPFAKFSMNDVYTSYVNLDSRPDRNERMITELSRIGVSAVRSKGLLPEEVAQFITSDKLYTMQQRTPGAVGCHYSQVAVMEEALKQNKHAFVMEDDLVFCDDFQKRMEIIADFCSNHDWDIIWLGGTYHSEPTWHKSIDGQHTHPDLQMCKCDLNRDWEPTKNPNIVRTYGCWSTYAYIVNRKQLPLILERLDDNVYRSMGIDWLMILLQPQLLTFAFNPGCIKQYDNQSNIGNGITQFSIFETLGEHWYKQNL